MNTNKCCHLDLLLSGKTGRNAYNAELVNQDQAVPRHLDLPKLSELLKMRQNPADNDNEDDQENNKEQQAFTFLTEHLLGHVIGKRDWDIKRCFHRVSDYVSISDEAYTLLLCENVYEKWLKIKPPQAGEVRTVVRGSTRTKEMEHPTKSTKVGQRRESNDTTSCIKMSNKIKQSSGLRTSR
jgi:hypothetical protein